MSRPTLTALAALLAVAAVIHAIALTGPFQFDDHATVAIDPGARSFAAWWAEAPLHVRPLTKLGFVATHTLGEALGHVATGHRLGNIAIHLATLAVLWRLGARLLETCAPGPDRRNANAAALFASALLATHPLATEAVAYLSARSMVLGTLLSACSLLAWIGWRTRGGSARVAAAGLAAVAAGLARETAFVAPALWVLWEVARQAPAGREDLGLPWSGRRLRALAVPAFGAVVLGVLFTAWLLLHPRYADLLGFSAEIAGRRIGEGSLAPALQYFASALALARYPSIDPDLRGTLTSPIARLAVSACAWGLLALAWRVRRTSPHWLIGAAWIAAWIVPLYAVPVRLDAVSERHFYPAVWGASLAFAMATTRWACRPDAVGRAGRGAGAALLAVLALVSAVRVGDYRSEVALWEAAARAAPDKPRVLNNLGVAYIESARWPEARAVLRRAQALAAGDWQVADNLATAEAESAGPVRWPDAKR